MPVILNTKDLMPVYFHLATSQGNLGIARELKGALQGSKLKKISGRKFATSYENLVATLKMLVVKLIEAI